MEQKGQELVRIVMIDELTNEMKLAREIIDPETGRVLLGAGGTNLQKYAERLRNIGASYVYVQDTVAEDIELPVTVCEELRARADAALAEVYGKLQMDQHPEYMPLMCMVKELLDEVLGIKEFLINVYELRFGGGDFIGHSVNVALLSLLLGHGLGYDEEKLKKLGMGALLHDIGVAVLPKALQEKRGSLTEEEQHLYQQHPVLGYHLVKNNWEVSALSRGVILSHHERSDGTGYPRRLLKGDIHEFSRIVGLVDCFEELTGGHPLSQQMNIQETVEFLNIHGPEWFDGELTVSFISRIPIYQTGTTVSLNDGRRAVVISQNKGFPTRPVIRVFQDQKGKQINPGMEINLLEANHIFVGQG